MKLGALRDVELLQPCARGMKVEACQLPITSYLEAGHILLIGKVVRGSLDVYIIEYQVCNVAEVRGSRERPRLELIMKRR